MEKENKRWLDKAVFEAFPKFSREKLIITLIIVVTLLSRFLFLGARVMSHDEVNHVVPGYNYYTGKGYTHDPVTHGPFQFHMLALSYFMFGDSDYSSRIPAAIFSTAAVIFALFAFRKYLGRIGALLSGFLLMISPYVLFYGRYTRNEAFIELFAVMTFYAFLRYYEKRDDFSLYMLAVVTALQFATKEVAYIYCAQLLLFCGFIFLRDLWKMPWENRSRQNNAAIYMLVSLLLILVALACLAGAPKMPEGGLSPLKLAGIACGGVGALCLLYTIIFIVKALGWELIRTSASFNLIVFLGALILPQLTAFPEKMIGFDPLDYSSGGLLKTGIFLAVFLVISFLIGCWWNRKVFLKAAAAFYLIFIFFYTSVFTNGMGFFTGIIGSLGYWLSQQNVQRGGQPVYYYALIQLPVYEFAAIAGTILSVIFGAKYHKFWQRPGEVLSADDDVVTIREVENENGEIEEVIERSDEGKLPTLLFLLYWGVSSLIAYSIAGEKMPWLTVHIAIPLALSAAWGLGYLLEEFPAEKLFSKDGIITLATLITGICSLIGICGSLFGSNPPFAGKELSQLKATGTFALALIVFILSLGILSRRMKGWNGSAIRRTVALLIMTVLLILQGRTAFTASFINYDYANELLVYAHAAPGPKIALDMIEEIAARTGEGKTIKVAYDNDSLYPYWWYFRDYPNKYYFGEGNPTRELRNYDVIILNTSKDGRMEPIVKDEYYRYQYVRLWWPNQDYFYLTPASVLADLMNKDVRSGLFHIWLDRDYSKYAQAKGKTNCTPTTWDPRTDISVYIRKDVMRKMWMLTDSSLLIDTSSDEQADDEEKFVEIEADLVIGKKGFGDGEFNSPRGVAVSPDGERIYVLDSSNNRVQYFDKTGAYLGQWDGSASRGFNEPWGIATGPDGSVYIADTWNHRMMKFSADGDFLLEWYAGINDPDGKSFYGPRSVAVSTDGKVYVSDTGNKRIMIYDEKGNYLNQFGTAGMGMGELDEPVGIALLDDTRLAVADTWNQRVQVFDVSSSYVSVLSVFEVSAWYSQNLYNKPYIAGLPDGKIFITDPEGYLVNEYDAEGKLIRSFNGRGGDIDNFSMPTGITIAPDGAVWVVDAENSLVSRFTFTDDSQ